MATTTPTSTRQMATPTPTSPIRPISFFLREPTFSSDPTTARAAVFDSLLRVSREFGVRDAVALSNALEIIETEASSEAARRNDIDVIRAAGLLNIEPLPGLPRSSSAAASAGVTAALATVASQALSSGSTGTTASVPLVVAEGLRWVNFAAAAYATNRETLATALARSGLQAQDILWSVTETRPLVPAHFLAYDEKNDVLVLSIRGTSSIGDIISDLAATTIPFAGGTAHLGMASLVDGLLHFQITGEELISLEKEWTKRKGIALSTTSNFIDEPTTTSAPISADMHCNILRSAGESNGIDTFSTSVGRAWGSVTIPPPLLQPTLLQQQSPAQTHVLNFADSMRHHDDGTALRRSATRALFTMPPLETFGLCGVAVLLQRALRIFPTSRVVITGHSLGAGVAALLMLKLVRIMTALHREVVASSQGQAQMLIVPPRPWSAWAFAAPACAGPELGALAALSLSDFEKIIQADFESRAEGRVESQSMTLENVKTTTTTTDSNDLWPMLRRLPLVHSVVLGADIVPRLTAVSLKELATRCATAKRPLIVRCMSAPHDCFVATGAAALIATRSVADAITSFRRVCCSCCCRTPSTTSTPLSTATTTTTTTTNSGGNEGYSDVMRPLAEFEANLGIHTPHTVSDNATLRERLEATGVPTSITEHVLRTAGPNWIAPGQALVVPGCVYHITTSAEKNEPNIENEAGVGTLRVAVTDAESVIFRGRRVPPAYLSRILVNKRMVDDHNVDAIANSVESWLESL